MIGKTLRNYRITDKIGVGGQGAVYKATDIKLGRTVVIKVLPDELVAREANLRRFDREARLASSLDHPNICTIFDLDEVEGVHFIAMQHVEGKNVQMLGWSSDDASRAWNHSSRHQVGKRHGDSVRPGEGVGLRPG